MTFRNRLTVLIAAACLAATLAACSNPSPEAGRPDATLPSSTGGPSSTAPPVTPSPTNLTPTTAPSRPASAVGSSLAAGEAFIAYYLDLLNYSYATGDSKPFMTESDKGCLGCKALAEYVQKVNASNGGLQGDFQDRLQAVKEIYRGESGRLGGSATLKSGDFVEHSGPSASPVKQKSATGTMEFTLSPSGGNWVMFEMQIS